jgi:hypothetical protein
VTARLLETTLSTSFVPGSNLAGDVAGASWRFLHPTLDPQQALILGTRAPATVAALERAGWDVTVADPPAGLPDELPGGADAIFVSGRAGIRWLERNAPSGGLRRLLAPGGRVYADLGSGSDAPRLAASLAELGRTDVLWLAPLRGELRAAASIADELAISRLIAHNLEANPPRLPVVGPLWRTAQRRLLAGHRTRRAGVVLATSPDDPGAAAPPRYLRVLAARSGLSLDGYRFAFSAPGKYASRKVTFTLFEDGAGAQLVVKLTRDPALNPRLENEWRALTALADAGIGADGTLPRPLFTGSEGGLAVVAETAVEGEPFRRRAEPSASGSHVQAALDRLLELATAPAPPATAEPREVATVLEDLLLRFVEVYRPDARESAFLAGQISSIAGSERPVPVAFQHGDPGTWNLLARPGGNVAFLDWEAAELRGMPLWDVFYFLRSFGVFLARARGTRDALKAFEQQFLRDGESSLLLAGTVDRYCERTGLDRPLVEPLFHTCWLHRSLKEATRLTPDRLQQGHYVRLLRLGIDRRASAPLRRVFDGSAP